MKRPAISVFRLSFCILIAAAAVLAGPVLLDTSFNTSGYRIDKVGTAAQGSTGEDIAVQPDGKIVISGSTVDGAGPQQFALARLNPNGSYDTTFGGTGKVVPSIGFFVNGTSLLIQPDGRIIQAGFLFNGTTNSNDFAAARYLPNGTLDNSFDGNGLVTTNRTAASDDKSYGAFLQPDGKLILVGTTAADTAAATDILIVRYNSDGSLDGTFAGAGVLTVSFPDFSEGANAVTVQPDGKILMAGYLSAGATGRDGLLVRLNANGTVDGGFGSGGVVITPITLGNDEFLSIKVGTDGSIFAGALTPSGGAVLKYNSAGTPDAAFGTDGIAAISSAAREIVLMPDGKIVAGGLTVTRLNTNGSPDTAFNNTGTYSAPTVSGYYCSGRDIALQADSRLLLLGTCASSTMPQVYNFGVFRVAESAPRSYLDFDGDSKTDFGIFRPGPGEWWYLRSTDGTARAAQFGAAGDVIVPGDYTGDGKADMATWRPSTGQWFVLRSEDSTFYGFPFGAATDTPAPADYDGDGKFDAAIYRPSTGTWFILRSSGGTSILTFGGAGDRPVPADYDGDGKADIAIFRPNGQFGAEWWLVRSSDGQNFAASFGIATDRALPGDYTGDGKADIAIFRPTSGEWFVLRSEDFSFYGFPFGAAGDIPAPGDFDGDGRFDATVFRPSTGTWYSNRSTAGTIAIGFGTAGDIPVTNAYVR